jgi:sirohydrochlorin ferrochelatase
VTPAGDAGADDRAAPGDRARADRLVTVAHGTRTTAANAVAREVTAAAAQRLGVPGTAAYVELQPPLFEEVMAANAEPAVVVPLLLSTGYHVRHDVPRAVATSRAPVTLTPPLGPHPRLAAVQVARLREAGVEPGRPVTMVATGSRDVLSASDLCVARGLLAAAWGGDVRLAVLSGGGRRPAEVVRAGDAVSPYLLAGGFFAATAARECREAGAADVANVLGPHPYVIDLVVDRVRAVVGAAGPGFAARRPL